MYVLMICFIAVVLIIGIFCVVVVTRDIVNEERAKKNASEAATATPVVVYQPAPAPQQTEEPEVEEPKEEPAEQVIDTEVDTPATTTYIIGKVTGQSYLLGLCVYVLKKPVGIVCVVIVPCLLMIVIQIFRIANVLGADKKNKRKEEQANKDDEIEELKRQLAALQNAAAPEESADRKEEQTE